MSFNSRGFSLIESLLAAGLLSLAVLGTGVGYQALERAHKKSKIVDNAIEIESQLVRAVTQNSTYANQNNALSALRLGNIPAAGELLFDLCPDRQPNGTCLTAPNLFIEPNQTRCFDIQMAQVAAAPCQFGAGRPDALQITLSPLKKVAGATPRYSLDYYFEGDPAYGKLALMGESASTINSNANDLRIQIPIDAYLSIQDTQCTDSIPGFPVLVGLNGYDKTTTPPTVSCIRMPAAPLSCPAQTFPKSLYADPIPSTNDHELKIVCGPTARLLRCDPGYALNGFDPTALDPAVPFPTPNNWCTYRGAATANPGTTFQSTTNYMGGRVCPPNYRVDLANSSCTIQGGAATPVNGICPTTYHVECSPCVAPGTQTCNYVADPALPPQAPPGPYTVGFDAAATAADPQTAVCQMTYPAQICGSHWTGTLLMTVSCVLNVTDPKDAF